jgi:hypothetical protein
MTHQSSASVAGGEGRHCVCRCVKGCHWDCFWCGCVGSGGLLGEWLDGQVHGQVTCISTIQHCVSTVGVHGYMHVDTGGRT